MPPRRGAPWVLLPAAALLLALPSPLSALPLPPALPPHPRLILLEGDLERIHKNIAAEPLAAQLYAGLLSRAAEIASGHARFGGRGGGVRDIAYTMGLAWRLTKNATIGRQGVEALLKVARQPDICTACLDRDCKALEAGCPGPKCAQNAAQRNPDPLCFGVTGEGLAVGYDWLWEAMTSEERGVVSHTITTQILNVYSQGLSRAFTEAYWFRSEDNFNSVVNSGAALAALAVLDDGDGQPYGDTGRFARDTLQAALLALPHGATSMYPDGATPHRLCWLLPLLLPRHRRHSSSVTPRRIFARRLIPRGPRLRRLCDLAPHRCAAWHRDRPRHLAPQPQRQRPRADPSVLRG